MPRKLLIRFDDICPTMDFAQWQRAEQVLRQYGIKPLLGVIPECRDSELLIEPAREDFWEYVRQLQADGYAIAMHGLYHVYDIKNRGRVAAKRASEFAGHPYAVQLEKIRKGKEILLSHGIATNIFFAPSHSYDDNTLKALAANGFKYLSDGFSKKAINRFGIVCLPCRSFGAGRIKKNGCITNVFHAHEWAYPDKQRDCDRFVFLCRTYTQDIVSFAEYAAQPVSNSVLNLLSEIVFRIYRRHIYPVLCSVYNAVFVVKRKTK